MIVNTFYILGLFSPLLRLLATHFPHLSLVDDWIEEEQPSSRQKIVTLTRTEIIEGMAILHSYLLLILK